MPYNDNHVYNREQVEQFVFDALHTECNTSLEKCGASEYHRDASYAVVDILEENRVISFGRPTPTT